MRRMPNPRVLVEVLRSGNLRARLRAARDGQAAVRLQLVAAGVGSRGVGRAAGGAGPLQLVAAAVDLGVFDALVGGPVSTAALADRLGAPEPDLLAAYLRVLAAAG